MVDNIKIGDQNWSNVNLNSNEFRNGEKIEIVKDPKDWFELNKNNKPACCYYNFNESNGQKLGLLYNWFSVIDPRYEIQSVLSFGGIISLVIQKSIF